MRTLDFITTIVTLRPCIRVRAFGGIVYGASGAR